ncbi:MAG: WecB/TagA/CpsF family glycosyltransferase [Nitrospira sp.]|nr:WecB/TagA/CpsF family glycosyltransferase [bacterium]MBL7047945.1 WecB/TagA/CpsF family glycosyltransferase [Nitrospira sp.]
MSRNTVVILGIPIDNLNKEETIGQIFSMIEDFKSTGIPSNVVTANVDFVVNTLKWGLKNSSHPELLDILRRADLVTPDGMPIVWTSKLLGTPLKERVTGADLVPRIAEEAVKRGKSIYFLGGSEDSALKAAGTLTKYFPGLHIAGTGSPYVQIEGEALAEMEESDRPIIKDINKSGADILFIGFGNPKQELWYERNKSRLKVPVSIGVGGTFDFINGKVKRAPLWMQKSGMEWLYRISQDPKRLWKRYFVGFFKFGLIVLPSILYYRQRLMLFNLRHKKIAPPQKNETLSIRSSRQTIEVLKMPERLDRVSMHYVFDKIDNEISNSRHIVFDFSNTSFIDSSGLGSLLEVWREMTRDNKNLSFIGINFHLRHFFELNRTWDLFKAITRDRIDDAMALLDEKDNIPPFYYSLDNEDNQKVLSLAGRLDAAQIAALDINSLINEIGMSNCILNLDELNFVDSSGLVLFFRVQKHLSTIGKKCVLCTLNKNIQQVFHITKLNRLFNISKDLASARQVFEVVN